MSEFNPLWLLWIGFALLTIGIVKSVQEEWPRQGIGDTSYVSLCLWIGGTGSLLGWGVLHDDWVVVGGAAVPLALYVCWVWIKVANRLRSRHR